MNDAAPLATRRVRVSAIEDVALGVKAFDLVSGDGRPLPAFDAGAHIDVHLPSRLIRQYSICSDPADRRGYTIAVKVEPDGRGGSSAMHASIEVGSYLGIGLPKNHFPLANDAERHVFVAGGIGVTPILAMIRAVHSTAGDWTLHYCARSEQHAAFYGTLKAIGGERVIPYFSEAPLLRIEDVTAECQPGEHLYCCGPKALMTAVEAAAKQWPSGQVHFEWFANPLDDGPKHAFEVELRQSGLVLAVPPDRSILSILREHGVKVPSSCEEGVCGHCETTLLAGEPDHRDKLLSAEERAQNRSMMVCVSRAKGERLILDL